MFLISNKINVSKIKFFLIILSKGVSVENEGVWLTSSNHGLRLESKRISKPNNSKHYSIPSTLCYCDLYKWAKSAYTLWIVLTITYLIYDIN